MQVLLYFIKLRVPNFSLKYRDNRGVTVITFKNAFSFRMHDIFSAFINIMRQPTILNNSSKVLN